MRLFGTHARTVAEPPRARSHMPVLALLLLAALAAPAAAGGATTGSTGGAPAGSDLNLPVVFPEHEVTGDDAYLCTAVQIPDKPLKLVGIEPTSDQRIVHHMLLFGCKHPAQTATVWDCKMSPTCSGGTDVVLYGWGKNAPAIALPPGVGYSVGPGTGIRALVLQMHYLKGRPANDTSGIRLQLSERPVPFSAGLLAFASGFAIPPGKPSTLVPNGCCYSGWEPLRGFATRVHTHALGREVYLNRTQPAGLPADERVIGLDPQKPQGFYPVQPEATFLPGDRLTMACDFDSTGTSRTVHAGHTSSDEMCNLYLMLYSHLPYFMWCLDKYPAAEVSGPGGLPKGGRLQPETALWQPPAEVPPEVKGGNKPYPLGQVSGLASNGDGTVWVFHRGQRAWNPDGSVFDASGDGKDSVLPGPAVLQLDQDSGQVLRAWGAKQFVMPHMVSLDYDGNVWLTDVDLHQVFKYSPTGKQLLALGTRSQRGDSATAFCKPTQVFAARDGSVFVSDGYCNSRVAEFDANGTWVQDYRLPQRGELPMFVAHSVVYDECSRRIYVADREFHRVHAFERGTGAYLGQWDLGSKYGAPYSLAIGPYGTVLVLAWQSNEGKIWVVALQQEVGQVTRAYEVPGGLEAPHDMVLLPAPLELTGSGERLLSILVSETKDGTNMHKYVLAEPTAGASSAQQGGAAGAAAGGEQEDDEAAAIAAAKAAAAAHFGGSTHQHQQPGALAGGEEEEARVGHSMVKPVDGAEQQQQQQQAQQVQQQAEPGEGDEGPEDGGEQQGQQPAGGTGAAAGGDATHIGHSMVKPVEEEEEGQQAGQQEQHVEQQAAQQQQQREPEDGSQADFLEDEDEQQQQQRRQQEQQEVAAATGVKRASSLTRGREEERHALGHAEAQPWVLGLVFVGVALAAWSRLQHWRRRGGAGYHAPPGAGTAAANGSGLNGSGLNGAGASLGVHRHHLVHGHLPNGVSSDLPSPQANV
ncbi:hypothetical protein ABPG75_012591 [Micractinium tetrahymenae]